MIDKDLGRQALDEADVHVTKIGGANAVSIARNADRVMSTGKGQILVISALRDDDFNTTSQLIALTEALEQRNTDLVQGLTIKIHDFHMRKVQENVPAEFFCEFESVLEHLFDQLCEKCTDFMETDDVFSTTGLAEWIKGFGEMVSEKLYAKYFELRGRDVGFIDIDVESVDSISNLRRKFLDSIEKVLGDSNPLVVTGGHSPVLSERRGYSDLKAAELARAVDWLKFSTVLSVEKQVPIMSADPRLLNDASEALLIRELSRQRAGELFGIKGAQAGAVHPDVIHVLEDTDVNIVIHNPDNLEMGTTFIGPGTEDLEGSTIVATKDIPTTLEISGPMSLASGVLFEVTKVLQGVVIDQTYSSENTWVITLNDSLASETTLELKSTLDEKYGSRFNVIDRDDYSLVMVLRDGINGQTSTLKKAGVRVIYANGIDSAGFTALVVPNDDVFKAINTLHSTYYD